MVELATWLASLPFSRALRQLNWLVPWLQIIHILANGIILSAVVMIDLRVWGVSRSQASPPWRAASALDLELASRC